VRIRTIGRLLGITVGFGLGARALAGCGAPAPSDPAEGSIGSAVQDDEIVRSLPRSVAEAAVRAANEGPVERTESLDRAPKTGVPIFEPGEDVPSFYEVALSPGWAILTTGEQPRAIEMGAEGDGPVTALVRGQPSVRRLYRLDTALYVAADAAGHAIAQSSPIFRIDRSGPKATFAAVTADDALADYAHAKGEFLERFAAETGLSFAEASAEMRASAKDRTCATEGDVPSYRQISPNQAPNDTSCSSGCGATAWAVVVGWASRRASQSPADAAFSGLFRQGDDAKGTTVTAPLRNDSTVAEVTWTIREGLGTFCLGDQGATTPWDMDGIAKYIGSRAPSVNETVKYNSFFFQRGELRDAAVDAICDGRPAIIGTGSIFAGSAHYPIAKGYKPGWFELEMGWGGNENGWYEAGTWFMGSLSR